MIDQQKQYFIPTVTRMNPITNQQVVQDHKMSFIEVFATEIFMQDVTMRNLKYGYETEHCSFVWPLQFLSHRTLTQYLENV